MSEKHTPRGTYKIRPAVDVSWQSRGACRGSDLDFVPEDGSRKAEYRAKQICRGCQVIDECLDYALQFNEAGIWGGMTPNERRQLRRKNRRTASCG